MAVVFKISTDWDTGVLEYQMYASEWLARDYLECDPCIIAAMIEEDKTLQEFIDLGWISIEPMELITE